MPNLFSGTSNFDVTEIKKYIENKLNGAQVDSIVGISMGGLLAPHLARIYPKAKLVLIGTGPYLKTSIPIYNFLLRLEQNDEALVLVRLAKKVPKGLYKFIYKTFNRHEGLLAKMKYKDRADENLEALSRIPLAKIKEILRFVVKTDNTQLLSQITNQTIIFAGTSDVMMPVDLARKMHELIKSSVLLTSDHLHYDVFTEKDCQRLDQFLKATPIPIPQIIKTRRLKHNP